MRLARGLLMFAIATGTAQGQSILRGTVTDSVSQRPIPGAVVTMLNAKGDVVGRTLTDASGRYATSIPADATRVRTQRIGWRPRERALPEPIEGIALANFTMPQIPTFLEPARVDAKQCPKRTDSQMALGLWEQVRTGLLATIVAREQNPAAVVRLGFDRVHRGLDDNDIVKFSVRRDSSPKAINSYHAVRSASAFIRDGFAGPAGDPDRMFYAPDADILIDGAFASGYCFRIERGGRARPSQVGLAFAAADRQPGRIDVQGALWVDTVARSLRDIEFRYVGNGSFVDNMMPGGYLGFHEMPNGLTVIDNWYLRLLGNRPDSSARRVSRGVRTMLDQFYASFSGGELAHARWPDGTKYDAELATVTINALNTAGTAATGRIIGLLDSPYAMVIDDKGLFEVTDLLPGPYSVAVSEPRIRPLMLDSIEVLPRLTAVRGKNVAVKVVVPTLEEWVIQRCGKRVKADSARLILGRILDVNGRPIRNQSLHVETLTRLNAEQEAIWVPSQTRARTDGSGVFQMCDLRTAAVAQSIRVTGELPTGAPFEWEAPLSQTGVTLVPVLVGGTARRP